MQARTPSKEKFLCTEPIQVYCRIRPSASVQDQHCLKPSSQCSVLLSQPSFLGQATLRNGTPLRHLQYTFRKVFGEEASQKDVFDVVALPLVRNVVEGRSSLLFTYGVTGSGKTHTMTGSPEDGGVMPRCLDVIFNSIQPFQAKKFIFKSDKLNGFEVQSETDANFERDHVLFSHISQTKGGRPKIDNKDSDPDLAGRTRDPDKVNSVDPDCAYAVFVTYVEIYNNSVYDLLEDLYNDAPRPKPLQAKIVREDPTHNMYVHGVTEVEVYSSEEAFDVFYKGQKRRRVAQTALNAESSRAHTVFTVRVVQAPLDANGEAVVSDKKCVKIGQLCLVDLAGSERSARTKNSGQRIREAGNINNSLLTLRTCLELLKENQTGSNKMIPYRESRLTHLFKNYFDGEGQVSMIICVSPAVEEYDETIQVLKFAEMSQEVQLSRTQARPTNLVLSTPSRRKPHQGFKQPLLNVDAIIERDSENNVHFRTPTTPLDAFSDIPGVSFVEKDDDSSITNLIGYLETNSEMYNNYVNNLNKGYQDFREQLLKSERETFMATQEMKSMKSLYDVEKNKAVELEEKLQSNYGEMSSLKRKCGDFELSMKRLRRELTDKNMEMRHVKLESDKMLQKYKNEVAEAEEKLNVEMQKKLQSQKSAIEYELKSKERKLKEVRRIVSCVDLERDRTGAVGDGSCSSSEPLNGPSACPSVGILTSGEDPSSPPPSVALASGPSLTTPPPVFQTPAMCRSTARKLGVAVSNRRHRRSRSVEVWLDHRPAVAVPLATLMQPKMSKKRSITKLTQPTQLTEGMSKYCLMTQGQDEAGDLETRLYKGDVIPTSGGGAQVMFNDVEVLKQVSPTHSPRL